jgi:hypothetical protein
MLLTSLLFKEAKDVVVYLTFGLKG